MTRNSIIAIITTVTVFGCANKSEPIIVDSEALYQSIDKVTEIMIHDIFSPPVASRNYAYPNIAAYETIAQGNDKYQSLAGQITDLTAIPKANQGTNLQVAALVAHMQISKQLIFSEEKMQVFTDSLYTVWKNKNEDEFETAQAYGMQVATHISEWIDKDNYKQTRTMPKFTVDANDASRWQPTPPAYMDGIEPHWMKIRPLVLTSADQFKPVPPPPFSMEKDSDFYKELEEVYTISNNITEKGDASEEIAIAQFWDCNPYVSVTRGHLMFATKKITPGAHWIGITKIAAKKEKYDFDDSIYAFTKTSIGVFDAFISCWDEKYRSNLIRPETLINQFMDEDWKPILQTPPFPEYVSGHSVVSGAAATALTAVFGENFKFEDTTELPFGIPMRPFKSFNLAAREAADSRLYGGIHYRAAVDIGLTQGINIGKLLNTKISFKK